MFGSKLVAVILLAAFCSQTVAYHPRCSGITNNSLKSRCTSAHVRSGSGRSSSSGSGHTLQAITDVNYGLSDSGVSGVVGLAEAIAIGGGVYLLCQLAAYWKLQFITANMLGGIPSSSGYTKIVELDAQDGKNVFYMPKNADYTAVMTSTANEMDPKKKKEKAALNEQLILECVGKANRENLNLSGKIRESTKDIPNSSADCVLSINALDRAFSKVDKVNMVAEAYRLSRGLGKLLVGAWKLIHGSIPGILRPGGLFVFVEADKDKDTLDSVLYKVFPRTTVVSNKVKAVAKAAVAVGFGGDAEGSTARAEAGAKKKKGKGDKRERSAAGQKKQQEDDLASTSIFSPDEDGADEKEEMTAVKADADADADLARDIPSGVPRREVKQTITFEQFNNVIFPYVQGIAVKP